MGDDSRNQEIRTSAYRNITVTTVSYSQAETNAIMHFNRDRRFTITE